jgi:hypothetical protein
MKGTRMTNAERGELPSKPLAVQKANGKYNFVWGIVSRLFRATIRVLGSVAPVQSLTVTLRFGNRRDGQKKSVRVDFSLRVRR